MPQDTDFRASDFKIPSVESSGKFVGRTSYWKIYAVENFFRVIIHSVLSAQIDSHWWSKAVRPHIQAQAQRFRQGYLRRPWHTSPGSHDIYYTHLSDLNDIMLTNKGLFLPLIPDVDRWIVQIEELRLPRNIVGHMNYPNRVDRKRIDVLHSDIRELIKHLEGTGFVLQIP